MGKPDYHSIPALQIARITLLRHGSYAVQQSSPEIKAWMREHNVTSISELETYFEERVFALASAAGRSYIVWQVYCSLLCSYARVT